MSLDASNAAYSNTPTPVINRSRHSNTFSPVGASSARNDSTLQPTAATTATGAGQVHTARNYMSPTVQRQWQDSGQFTPLVAQRYQQQQQQQQQFDTYSESTLQQQQVPLQFTDVFTPLRKGSSSCTAAAGDDSQQRDRNAAAAHYSSSSSRGNMPNDAPVYTSDDTLLGAGMSPIQRVGSYRSSTTMRTAASDAVAAAAVAADVPVTPARLRAAAGATAHYDSDSTGSDGSSSRYATAATTAGADAGAAAGGSGNLYSSITATPLRRVQFVEQEWSDDGSSTTTTTTAVTARTAGEGLRQYSTAGASTVTATAAGASSDAFDSPLRTSQTAAGDAERSNYIGASDTAASADGAGTANAAVASVSDGTGTKIGAGLQSFLSPQQRSTSIVHVSQQ
jgi:hypothetical protein